ncbi:MAG: carbamoyl-phosphate synthase large subunit [Firmicutes bacterium]|nr:carbamoyl-phosphate synthase large subunit [Bacillota bacterium]
MSKRTDIKKVMVIGSGPIVIGQAAEFDYAGTQACIALKEEGYEVLLVNSNPATIMTDAQMADKIYMEPLTFEYAAKIIRCERPDALLPGIGGQTGLNLAMELERSGVLAECGTELVGTSKDSIQMAEDRELFKEMCLSIDEPVLPSVVAHSLTDALQAAEEIGYPLVLRPAFTLGGTGGGFAVDEAELRLLMKQALDLSPVHQVLVEKSVKGYKEIEFEVMRDANDTAIAICDMENVDPCGIHTGDSIVVAPCQTLEPSTLAMLKKSALKIIRKLEIAGGCNIQFALNPHSDEYYLIEVNPRVSRSSALASKASGYPIARVTAKIAMGLSLDEITVGGRPASCEPTFDYIVTKMPRFPFDKFVGAENDLGTKMMATGEVMSIGKTLEESMLKAVRSLEVGVNHIYLPKFDTWNEAELLEYVREGRDDRLFALAELMSHGTELSVIHEATMISELFLQKIRDIVDYEFVLKAHPWELDYLIRAKRMGFSDHYCARMWKCQPREITAYRRQHDLWPTWQTIDACSGGVPSSALPYFYSTYAELPAESEPHDRKKIIVLGSGPIRIGQGVEFDYSTVHAVQTIRDFGYEAIIINNNPETVSTDYTTGDKLYFEPLTVEDALAVIEYEKPLGVIASLGGQTAINLAAPLAEQGVNIIGASVEAIERAENRDVFERIMEELGIPQPPGQAVTNVEDGVKAAASIGYPVLVRPSYVLGGRAMQIVSDENGLRSYLQEAVEIDADKPVLVDKYISGRELEVDAVCDGHDVFVAGIIEHVERTGVHSGDSISVYPAFSVSDAVKGLILQYTKRLGLAIGVVGLFNIQFIATPEGKVYVIEVNPRSSRTVPFLSKSTGWPLADIATRAILGLSLKEQGIFDLYPEEKQLWYVKAPAFSFSKLRGVDTYLSPEMKSTGEAIGYDTTLRRALYKALKASGMDMADSGEVFVTLFRDSREEALPLVERFYALGFNVTATPGTARFLQEHGIHTRVLPKISDEHSEILDELRQGRIAYVINTRDPHSFSHATAGFTIRSCAASNGVTTFTALDTAAAVLDVLEETALHIAPIA